MYEGPRDLNSRRHPTTPHDKNTEIRKIANVYSEEATVTKMKRHFLQTGTMTHDGRRDGRQQQYVRTYVRIRHEFTRNWGRSSPLFPHSWPLIKSILYPSWDRALLSLLSYSTVQYSTTVAARFSKPHILFRTPAIVSTTGVRPRPRVRLCA